MFPTTIIIRVPKAANPRSWEFRAAFPDRASFDRFYGCCREHYIGFDFTRLYDEQEEDDGPGYGLTERPREALVGAIGCGYFEIPRKCSLSELGAYLGISETATSERVRSAVKRLVMHTIYLGSPES